MSIKDKKQKIFGKIAALKTLNDDYPEFKLTNSFPSINNSLKSIEFLIDLMKSLIGQEEFKNVIVKFLTYKLHDLEKKVKDNLKDILINNITNGTNPSIPSFFTDGIEVNVSDLDFFSILQTDPLSSAGKLLYNDEKSGLDSADFNTFLFESLQKNGTSQKWGSQAGFNDILEIGVKDDKTLNVKPTSAYTNKKLSEFNNDFIDSLILINTDKVVTKFVDGLYGTVATHTKKSKESMILEYKIGEIVDRFINLENDMIIDDSFFNFSNSQIRDIEEIVSDRRNGIRKLIDCNNYESSVNFDTLSVVTSEINNASTLEKKQEAISKGLDTLMDDINFNTSDIDKKNVNLNFLIEIIKEISNTLVKSIMSPSIILLVAINSKIFEGGNKKNIKIPDSIGFLKDNNQIFKQITWSIKDNFIEELLSKITKKIIGISNATSSKIVAELSKNSLLTLLSLTSTPPDVLEKIRGL